MLWKEYAIRLDNLALSSSRNLSIIDVPLSLSFCGLVIVFLHVESELELKLPLSTLFQVFTLENGPAHDIWRNISVTVNAADKDMKFTVDWLKYAHCPLLVVWIYLH